MPLGLAIGGANTHDQKLLFDTLDSLPLPRSRSSRRQHLCLDKGYDCEAIRRRVRRRGYVPHIRSRGEEQSEKRMRGKRARRWVVGSRARMTSASEVVLSASTIGKP